MIELERVIKPTEYRVQGHKLVEFRNKISTKKRIYYRKL